MAPASKGLLCTKASLKTRGKSVARPRSSVTEGIVTNMASGIGLPKGMTRDEAYVAGLADGRQETLDDLERRIPNTIGTVLTEKGSYDYYTIGGVGALLQDMRDGK